jgi:hypothetical protein
MKRSERNFWLDLVLFTTFFLTAFTGLFTWLLVQPQTALTFPGFNRDSWLMAHIYSGLASVLCTVIHVVWHKEWLSALRGRTVSSLPLKLKANRTLDRIIWIAFLSASGFALLDFVLPGSGYQVSIFGRLHVAFGIVLLVGIIVHLVFHRKWISSIIRGHFLNKAGTLENTNAAQNYQRSEKA